MRKCNFAFSDIMTFFSSFSRTINLAKSVLTVSGSSVCTLLSKNYKEKTSHGSYKSYCRNLPSVKPSVAMRLFVKLSKNYKEKPVMAAVKVIVETYLQ